MSVTVDSLGPGALVQEEAIVALERALEGDGEGPALGAHLTQLVRQARRQVSAADELVHLEPGLTPRVAALRRDRRRLLEEVQRLAEALTAGEAGPAWRELRRRLARSLKTHRHHEEALVLDAYCRELGGEGS